MSTVDPKRFRIRAVVAVLALVAAGNAFGGTTKLIYETERYTQVGTYDEHLSRLCAMGLFNQRSQFIHSAYFKKDRIKLGAAMGNGWNLKDPTGARRYMFDYWFRHDGFSTCEVYHSRNAKRAPGPARAGG